MPNLKGKVAVVTGASRNVGMGIAFVLGDCGATVYVTGRSTRGALTRADFPTTIEDTAEMVTARGGVGIPVCVDHTVDEQVEALFERIKQEQGRIDILVNNVWDGYKGVNDGTYDAPLWEQPLWRWEAMFDAGSRAHFTASRFAIPLMLPQRQGLIVMTTYLTPHTMEGPTSLVSLSKWTINGLVYALAHQLWKHNIAVVGVVPAGSDGFVWGWSREELRCMHDALHTTGSLNAFFREHRSVKGGESPEYTGRAVVALTTDPNVMEKSGLVRRVVDLTLEYGFTDIDGRRPSGYGLTEGGA